MIRDDVNAEQIRRVVQGAYPSNGICNHTRLIVRRDRDHETICWTLAGSRLERCRA
jgi:hypothetical protein